MRVFDNMVLWKKLVVVSVLPLLIISMMIGGLSYNRAKQTAQEAGRYSVTDTVNRIDISLTLRVRQIGEAVQALQHSVVLTELADGSSTFPKLCQYLLTPFQEIQGVCMLQGEETVCSIGTMPILQDNDIQQMYGRAASNPNRTLWMWSPSQETEQQILVYGGKENGDGEQEGLLILNLNARILGKTAFLKQKITDHQIGFLVDGAGNVIFADSSMPADLLPSVMEQYKAGKRMFEVSLDQKDYFCYAQCNGLTGWITFVTIATEELFPGGDTLRNYMMVLVAALVLAAVLLLMYLSRKITKPLRELNEGMKQVYGGNFDVRLDNVRTDEVGELTDTFNYMVNEIQVLVNQVYREQLSQKSAEMEALQAQINPHFLYNSLDSINWMLIDRNEMDISNVVVALGKLMQYSMDTSVSMVPLREEYRNVRDYMVVQHNRLEDQLEYELNLEPGLEEVSVPKLILQPLVENAIKHGVLKSNRPCLVTVWTRQKRDHIRITVRDNGAGMDSETLEACRRGLQGTEKSQKSIGLPNVARRLQLHFGGKCTFSVESAPDQGTEISLLIPLWEKGEQTVEADHH